MVLNTCHNLTIHLYISIASVHLETLIREAFTVNTVTCIQKRRAIVIVFFDLEKAYDTTWKYCTRHSERSAYEADSLYSYSCVSENSKSKGRIYSNVCEQEMVYNREAFSLLL